MTTRPVDSNPIPAIARKVKSLDLELQKLVNRKNVNLPFRSATNLPAQAADGDIVIAVVDDEPVAYVRVAGEWVILTASGSGSGLVDLQTYSIAGPRIVNNGNFPWVVPLDCTIDHIRISSNPGPTGSSLTVRINVNGSSDGTVSITSGNTTNTFTPSTTSLVVEDEITVDVTAVGSTIPGSNLEVQWIGSYD